LGRVGLARWRAASAYARANDWEVKVMLGCDADVEELAGCSPCLHTALVRALLYARALAVHLHCGKRCGLHAVQATRLPTREYGVTDKHLHILLLVAEPGIARMSESNISRFTRSLDARLVVVASRGASGSECETPRKHVITSTQRDRGASAT